MATTDQIRANQANAQHSTGPTSSSGKAASSQNARTLGLRSDGLVITSFEEKLEFDAWSGDLYRYYRPQGPAEKEQFHILLCSGWKRRRAEALETAYMDQAFAETINEQFPAEDQLPINPIPTGAADILITGIRKKQPRISMVTLQRLIHANERAFTRAQRELERLIKERQKHPKTPAGTNEPNSPTPDPDLSSSEPPSDGTRGAGHRFSWPASPEGASS